MGIIEKADRFSNPMSQSVGRSGNLDPLFTGKYEALCESAVCRSQIVFRQLICPDPLNFGVVAQAHFPVDPLRVIK